MLPWYLILVKSDIAITQIACSMIRAIVVEIKVNQLINLQTGSGVVC